MKHTISAEYVPGDPVYIVPLETPGRVVSVWIGIHGMRYEVAYFYNGDRKEVFMRGEEIATRPERVSER